MLDPEEVNRIADGIELVLQSMGNDLEIYVDDMNQHRATMSVRRDDKTEFAFVLSDYNVFDVEFTIRKASFAVFEHYLDLSLNVGVDVN